MNMRLTDAIRSVKSHFTCYVFIQHLKRIYYLFQKHFQTSVLHTSYHTFHPYCGADIGIQETFLRFVILWPTILLRNMLIIFRQPQVLQVIQRKKENLKLQLVSSILRRKIPKEHFVYPSLIYPNITRNIIKL